MIPPHPHPLLRWLAERLVARRDRDFLLGDLDDEFAARRVQGRPAALWYTAQALHACWTRRLLPAARSILARVGIPHVAGLPAEVRQTIRSLLRAPWYSATVVSVIALSISLATTVFTVVDGVLFSRLPYREVARLMAVDIRIPAGQGRYTKPGAGAEDLRRWEEAVPGLEAAGLTHRGRVPFGEGVNELVVSQAAVTQNLFGVLGMNPMMGGFQESDFVPAAPGVPRSAIISHDLWLRRFGGDPQILGRRIAIDPERGESLLIAGVMPRAFAVPSKTEAQVLLPLARVGPLSRADDVIVRVPAGMAPDLVQQRLQTVLRAATADGGGPPVPTFVSPPSASPDGSRRIVVTRPAGPGAAGDVTVTPLDRTLREDDRPMFLAVSGAAVGLMALACVSVAGLVASRGDDRARERVVRRALGAGRGAIARLVFIETTMLTGAAGAAGLMLAAPTLDATRRLLPLDSHLLKVPSLDWRATAFAVLAAWVTCVVVSVWPIWRTLRAGVSLRPQETGATARARWFDRAVVTCGIALAFGLTLAGALVVSSHVRIWLGELGFVPDGVLAAELRLRTTPAAASADLDEIIARVRNIPGVLGAALTDNRVLSHGGSGAALVAPPDAPADVRILQHAVTPEFFEVMRPRLLAGRLPAPDEFRQGRVIVVSEGMARAYWPGGAVGQFIEGQRGGLFSVAAVVADARYLAWDFEAMPFAYVPYSAFARSRTPTLFLRTDGRRKAVVDDVHRELAAAARVRVVRLNPLTDWLGETIRGYRFRTWLFGSFTAASLLLLAVGILGLVAATASRRTREIGVRMALGATSRVIVRQLLGEQMPGVAAGLILGCGAAWWSVGLLRFYLYEVTATDPLLWMISAGVIVLAAAAGTLVPALRASHAEPVAALRAD